METKRKFVYVVCCYEANVKRTVEHCDGKLRMFLDKVIANINSLIDVYFIR